MKARKFELVCLFNLGPQLPTELWWLVLELSGLVREKDGCLMWERYVPRFNFSRHHKKWLKKSRRG